MMIPNNPCTIDFVMSLSIGNRLISNTSITPAMIVHIKASSDRMLSFKNVSFIAASLV